MSTLHAHAYNISDASNVFKLLMNSFSKENVIKSRIVIIKNLIGFDLSNNQIVNMMVEEIKNSKNFTESSENLKHLEELANNAKTILINRNNKKPSQVIAEVIDELRKFNETQEGKFFDVKYHLNMLLASVTIQEIAKNPENIQEISEDFYDIYKKSLQKKSKTGIPEVFGSYYPMLGSESYVVNSLKAALEMYENELTPAPYGSITAYPVEFCKKFRENFRAVINKENFIDEAYELIKMASTTGKLLLGPSSNIRTKNLPKHMDALEIFEHLKIARDTLKDKDFLIELYRAKKHLSLNYRATNIVNVIYNNKHFIDLIINSIKEDSNINRNQSNAPILDYIFGAKSNKDPITKIEVGPLLQINLFENPNQKIRRYLKRDEKYSDLEDDLYHNKTNEKRTDDHELCIKWKKDHPSIPLDSIIIGSQVYENKEEIVVKKRFRFF